MILLCHTILIHPTLTLWGRPTQICAIVIIMIHMKLAADKRPITTNKAASFFTFYFALRAERNETEFTAEKTCCDK